MASCGMKRLGSGWPAFTHQYQNQKLPEYLLMIIVRRQFRVSDKSQRDIFDGQQTDNIHQLQPR
jgi:hypothetical protein